LDFDRSWETILLKNDSSAISDVHEARAGEAAPVTQSESGDRRSRSLPGGNWEDNGGRSRLGLERPSRTRWAGGGRNDGVGEGKARWPTAGGGGRSGGCGGGGGRGDWGRSLRTAVEADERESPTSP
jgi:hypothetical protein